MKPKKTNLTGLFFVIERRCFMVKHYQEELYEIMFNDNMKEQGKGITTIMETTTTSYYGTRTQQISLSS